MNERDHSSWTLDERPDKSDAEGFDLWCFLMVRVRGYSPHLVASRCDEPAGAAARAVRRVECGRWGSPFDIFPEAMLG